MTAAAALSRVAPCVRFPPARAAQRSARASAVSPRGIYALKPIGRSPAYFRKKSHSEEKKSFVVSLFGGGDAKIRIAALEYELDNSRAQSSKLNIEKRAAEAKVVELDDRLQMYVGRIKEAEKDVFKLERQLEEHQKGFDSGMSVAKRQIRMLEQKLEAAQSQGEQQ